MAREREDRSASARWFLLGVLGGLVMAASLFLPLLVTRRMDAVQGADGAWRAVGDWYFVDLYLWDFPPVGFWTGVVLVTATCVFLFVRVERAWLPASAWLLGVGVEIYWLRTPNPWFTYESSNARVLGTLSPWAPSAAIGGGLWVIGVSLLGRVRPKPKTDTAAFE